MYFHNSHCWVFGRADCSDWIGEAVKRVCIYSTGVQKWPLPQLTPSQSKVFWYHFLPVQRPESVWSFSPVGLLCWWTQSKSSLVPWIMPQIFSYSKEHWSRRVWVAAEEKMHTSLPPKSYLKQNWGPPEVDASDGQPTGMATPCWPSHLAIISSTGSTVCNPRCKTI